MSKRIDDIEILRAFAVLFVVAHHALGNLFTWTTPGLARVAVYFSGGFGVDLFFAISGFVIARELVPRLQASNGLDMAFRVTVAFWIRRAWRLLPSAWTWLVLTLIAVLFFNQSGVFGGFRTNLEATVAGVLQVANVRFAETFGRSEYGASFVYWTLSLEEQFYLLLPLLVLVSRRFLPHVLIALVIVQLLSTRTLMTVVFRTDAIALGVLLAIWSQHSTYAIARPVFLSRTRWAGTVAMLGLCFCMGVVGSEVLHVVSYKFSVFAVLSVLLVWIASYDMDLFIPVGPIKKLLLWVGTRSYAIYLIHIPAFYLSREIWFRVRPGGAPGDELFFPLLFTAGVLIALLSEFNYRLIEVPFRLHGAKIAKRFLSMASKDSVQADSAIQQAKG
ncbi:acyltransferase family protein [Aquipseudomonas alcaligenes]|uniref:Acyltransferase n=1 Tax=Aquipseudomonas alcaligenes TaxID=43263 RepID=A0A5C7WC18_AQUAC|nr:acyltransferase [Pseudomonas alcaligenes]TXI34104.1 MAG: acyltransferase [Pseudomonas alcaligenes]